MSGKKKLEAYREKISQEIDRISEEQISFAKSESEKGIEFINVTNEYIDNSGKMLRGILLATSYEAVTGSVDDEIFKAAASIEICQDYLLAHDDIADKASIRRGQPSYHHRTVDLFRKRGGNLSDLSPDTNLNIGMAVVGGDYMDALAQEVLCSVDLPSERILKAISYYSTTLKYTGYGQVLDILLGVTPMEEVTEKDIEAIHKLKTASYTLIYPLLSGCYLAGGTDVQIEGFTRFGEKVGIAFQIVDDILGSGLVADKSDKTKNDINEGKKTLLLLETWRKREDLREIIDRLGKEKVSTDDVKLVREAMIELDVVERSMNKAEGLLEDGLKALDDIGLYPEGHEFLEYIGKKIVHRDK